MVVMIRNDVRKMWLMLMFFVVKVMKKRMSVMWISWCWVIWKSFI